MLCLLVYATLAGSYAALRGRRRLLESAIVRLTLSVRAIHRALRVARTIADLEGTAEMTHEHVLAAAALRDPGAMLSAQLAA